MQETPTQYTRRILGYQKGKRPFTVLARTPRTISRLIAGAPRRAITAPPGPGRWSVAEIIAHLADTELVIGFRMRLVLGSNGTRIQSFDQDVWATNFRYEKHDPKASFDAFAAQRLHNLRLLRILPRSMWTYYGMHEERGKETIARMTAMMAGHDLNHLMQIEKILQGTPRR